MRVVAGGWARGSPPRAPEDWEHGDWAQQQQHHGVPPPDVTVVDSGGGRQVVSGADYRDLLRVARDHASLLSHIFNPAGGPERSQRVRAYWECKEGLSEEEARAISVVEYRNGLSVSSAAGPSGADLHVAGAAFCIAGDSVRILAPSSLVVAQFPVASVREMLHDDNSQTLLLRVAAPGEGQWAASYEVHCADQAVLRSIYFSMLMRHPERQNADPARCAEQALHRASPRYVPPGQLPPPRPCRQEHHWQLEQQAPHSRAAERSPPSADPQLVALIGRQQDQLDQLSRNVQGLHAAFAASASATPPPNPSAGLEPPLPPSPPGYQGLRRGGPLHGADFVARTGQRPAVVGARRSLLCGCDYSGSTVERPGGVADALLLRDFLRARGFGGEQVLLRDDDTAAMPTRANLIRALRWLVEGAQPGDALFFGFSGHGAVGQGGPTGGGGGLCPCDYAAQGLVGGETLRQLLLAPLPEGVRLTMVCDISCGGPAITLPCRASRGGGRAGSEAGGGEGDALLVAPVHKQKQRPFGAPGLVTAVIRAVNRCHEGTVATLLEDTKQALRWPLRSTPPGAACSVELWATQPLHPSRPFALGSQGTALITTEGEDREKLLAYLSSPIAAWGLPEDGADEDDDEL